MENTENLVIENQVTENVEQSTEESPKMFTEAEFNAKLDEVLGKKIARKEAKIRKEYDRKYGQLEEVLKAGTGKETVEEMTDTFKEFYQSKGIKLPEKPAYSDRDIAVLAKAEAEDIIHAGYEEVVDEVDRLAKLGLANMTPKEKAVFGALAEYRQTAERTKELASIGVTADEYNSSEFKDFASKFNPNISITDVYNIYMKTQPKKEIKPMGSIKSSVADNGGIKDFYTYEEASKFTKADFDKNPALYKKVQECMQNW